jgi:ABC-type amino acid transport substrate-binding protein
MAQAIVAGDLPIGGGEGNASVDAALAGADFVMLEALAKVPAYVMALLEIKTVEDLRGKVVGITLSLVHGFCDALAFPQTRHGDRPRRHTAADHRQRLIGQRDT